MLVVAGEIRLDPEKRDEAMAAALEMMAETQQEDGCVTYVFTADLQDPGTFRVFEEWETADALEAHFVAPHMKTFLDKMAGFGVTYRAIHRYEVSSVSLL